jgi:hypothetical protein
MGKHITRASAKEVQVMLARRGSRTDWKRARTVTQKAADLLANEDDRPLPEGWELRDHIFAEARHRDALGIYSGFALLHKPLPFP